MFKRQQKKTGCETPEYTTPPMPKVKPPKPMYRICSMKPEKLAHWVKTQAQIGDIAYYHDHISDHQYIYCYLKPDNNPQWSLVNPGWFTYYAKKEDKGEEKMEYKIDIDAMIKERLNVVLDNHCTYETPCGWCAKWDKKCDKKIGGYPTTVEQARKKVESNEGLSCYKCKHTDSISTVCLDCYPIYKNFEAKEN